MSAWEKLDSDDQRIAIEAIERLAKAKRRSRANWTALGRKDLAETAATNAFVLGVAISKLKEAMR